MHWSKFFHRCMDKMKVLLPNVFFSHGKRNASSRVNESENKLQCPSSFFFYYNGSHPMANEVKILLSLTSYTWLRRFSILTKDTENQYGHQVLLPDQSPSFLIVHQKSYSLMGHFCSILKSKTIFKAFNPGFHLEMKSFLECNACTLE